MERAAAPAPREARWRGLLLGLAAFLLLPLQSPINRLLPIDNTLLLLLPLLAACFVVGWWAGGSASMALVWLGLAAFVLTRPPVAGATGYYDLARAWGLLVAGSFGLVCVAGSRTSFISRALSSLALASAIGLAMALLAHLDVARIPQIFGDQLAARRSLINVRLPMPALETSGDAAARLLPVSEIAVALARLAIPALLALEALAAAALAWALYHRLSRARLGAPLSRFRDFRFNDQLIWGLVVGIVLVVLPSFEQLEPIGRNLVLFFGVLYALRGLGVMTWLAALGGTALRAWAVLLGLLFFWITPALAFGMGLGDTWFDVRNRFPGSGARPTP
jgi:hypothetical protein